MDEKVRVYLAKQYDLVVGDTFQLFYRGIVEAPNPYCYSIVALCEKGKSFPRYFEYTPQEEGRHVLTVSIYNAERKLLGRAETVLNVVSATAPKKQVNVLCVGDSLTQNGVWVAELNRRISQTDGEPKGNGFTNVNFVGTCSAKGVEFEGYGGWQWVSYTCTKAGAIWVQAPNDKTEQDQHSLWKDENGNIWQIETLQVDYLKLNRFKDHQGEAPKKGILTHYKNAVDTRPIEFFSSSPDRVSPFYNEQSGEIDFNYYTQKLGKGDIDVVYILLGANGLMRQIAMNNTRRDYCKLVKEEVRELVDKIKKGNKNVKIKLIAPPIPSCRGGIGSNYGAELPFADLYDIIHYTMELNIAYEELACEDGYKDFVESIHLTGQFDAEYSYPHIQKPVNARSSITEWLDTNGVHPTNEGSYQIADAVYRNLIKELNKI
ncbi:MAG: SGNH/GDSL hydrolase family protein [Clostridia bacterium]|nr:SGNH/GDSL hydrolase family protein [Clostridia bacterium]